MAFPNVLRTILFPTLLLFSLIIMGIGGIHGLHLGIGLVVSVLTWVIILPIFLVGILRRGSFLSWVSIELGLCCLLGLLWLAWASYMAYATGGVFASCDLDQLCQQYEVAQAFSWLNWLILFGYVLVLIVYTVHANGQGRRVWTSEVKGLVWTETVPAPPPKPEQASNTVAQLPMQQNYDAQPPYGYPGTPLV